ncbi:hypothetical protein ACHAXT_012082 [Thalassiosira profunda]
MGAPHPPVDGAGAAAAPPPNNGRNYAALGAIGGAFVGVAAFTAPFVLMQLRSSLPYMATPRGKVERALKFVSQRPASSAPSAQAQANKKGRSLNFVDLGSGDGSTLLAAASLGWRATGLELNPSLWFISNVRRLFSPKMIRSNTHVVLGDMFSNATARKRLQRADCVMIFGVKPLMPKIAELVQGECRPGCHLMSYRFPVPLVSDANTTAKVNKQRSKSEESGINATIIYEEEEMRIYELAGR